jgi:MFS transporter, OFA family, oxalate/formate antiporter
MTKSYNISKSWLIVVSAFAINLVVGILYSWSVLKKALVNDWGWTNTDASLPYTVAVAILAFSTIFAGRAQDKIGPRRVALTGGLLFGLGLIASGYAASPLLMMVTFGIVGGIGIGLGYAATTPCAIKWFDPSKKGLISGIVVSGVGLSPVYIAPLTDYFIRTFGIQQSFIILGTMAIVVTLIFAMFLVNPPEGFLPKKPIANTNPMSAIRDIDWLAMVKTKQFIVLWLVYMLSATAGLMLIGHLASIAATQASWQAGFILVVILSVFNALGRVSGGLLSDKVGRTTAMLIVFLLQAFNMIGFIYYGSIPLLVFGSIVAGLAYGALFSLFPATTADFFGVKNLGVNYGLIFTGWGVAGIIGPVLGGMVADQTGKYTFSYIIASGMLFLGAVLVKTIKSPQKKEELVAA